MFIILYKQDDTSFTYTKSILYSFEQGNGIIIMFFSDN